MMDGIYDIVIPLSKESKHLNMLLRLALRSVLKYVQRLGNIWIITEYLPLWIQNVNVIAVPDKHKHNKDANLFDKLLAAVNNPSVRLNFIFLSDDQLFVAPYDPITAKTVFNKRGRHIFAKSTTKKWCKRMTATFDKLLLHNIQLDCNFDAHVPVRYNKKLFEVLKLVDYVPEPGFCINTLVCGLNHRLKGIQQSIVKFTGLSELLGKAFSKLAILDKLYVGYNDSGFTAMKDKLIELFPHNSKYLKF